MPSFSRRRYAVTAFSQVLERLPDAVGAPETADHDDPSPADGLHGLSGGHGLVEDVDFDTAIAEVLMTLAADRGTLEDLRPADDPAAVPPAATLLEHEADTGFDHDGDDDSASAEDADEDLDPEALLAAEAATFRLLGELDRLWHRAA